MIWPLCALCSLLSYVFVVLPSVHMGLRTLKPRLTETLGSSPSSFHNSTLCELHSFISHYVA